MNLDILLTGTIDNYREGMLGGNLLNYAYVGGILKNDKGKVNGVSFVDKTTNKPYNVKSKVVVNCSGIFSDTIRRMDDPGCKKRILCVGGSHLILDKRFTDKKFGLLIPATKDGRVLFVLPWLDHSLIGTTEKTFDAPINDPQVTFNEMLFMVEEMQTLYPNLPVATISDGIQTKWSGIRPLILEEG